MDEAGVKNLIDRILTGGTEKKAKTADDPDVKLSATMQQLKETDEALAPASDWAAQLKGDLERAEQREVEYRSIFRRCRDIVAFHNGDDSEKVEAIRRTLLQAPHIAEERP